jgi:dsDNA-specific endonuclease/ATPase MutS2
MGLGRELLEHADALLSREDRCLDRMLRRLSASRAALEHEQHEARRLRAETEALRGEYRMKLEKLQARRDKLYRSMREDLDRAFRDAHRQIAQVVRDLQRGGTAQRAAKLRESPLRAALPARGSRGRRRRRHHHRSGILTRRTRNTCRFDTGDATRYPSSPGARGYVLVPTRSGSITAHGWRCAQTTSSKAPGTGLWRRAGWTRPRH